MRRPVVPVPDAAALALRGVGVTLRGRPILDAVDLDLAPGLVHGLIGPNGAGKSTLVRACLGLVEHTGTVRVLGHDAAGLNARQRAHLMAYLPQDTGVDAEITGRTYVEQSRYARLPRFGGLRAGDEAAVEAALGRTGADAWSARLVTRTSGGERQLTALARVLAQEAPVLLLDEPSSALDLGRELQVLRLLRPWVAEEPGRAAVVVLHDLTLAARFCDRLVLLSGGRVAAQGTPEHVLTAEALHQTYGVDADITHSPLTDSLVVTPL